MGGTACVPLQYPRDRLPLNFPCNMVRFKKKTPCTPCPGGKRNILLTTTIRQAPTKLFSCLEFGYCYLKFIWDLVQVICNFPIIRVGQHHREYRLRRHFQIPRRLRGRPWPGSLPGGSAVRGQYVRQSAPRRVGCL